jgi:hypothetical protein
MSMLFSHLGKRNLQSWDPKKTSKLTLVRCGLLAKSQLPNLCYNLHCEYYMDFVLLLTDMQLSPVEGQQENQSWREKSHHQYVMPYFKRHIASRKRFPGF